MITKAERVEAEVGGSRSAQGQRYIAGVMQLPIHAKAEEIVQAVRSSACVVVCGATGSGKTTQLPQLLLRAGLGKKGMIGHTQPRRIAARSVAQRIASEMGEKLGEGVGVQVRFDDVTSSRTRIKLMTDGIALAELVGDPLLSRYDAFIVDEAHERSLNIDLLLASLRLVIAKRPEFRVVVTSATIEPAKFSEYFGGAAKAPVIEVSGRSFPIRVIYREPASEQDARDWGGGGASPAEIADAVEEARSILSRGQGPQDVLVFVPGEREIRSASAAMSGRGLGAEVLPLFARLSAAEQDRVFATSGKPRVIIATNVAETSLTLPAIGAVVDTGVARISRYDPQRRVGTLPIEAVSKASCDQRAGRCGRVAPGVCLRLYSEASYARREQVTTPEVLRTNLAGLVLRCRTLPKQMLERPCETSGLPVALLQPPPRDAVSEAEQTLFELHAMQRDGSVTHVGRALSRMPVDPRVGRMLLAARSLHCAGEVLILAAGLSMQDARERPMGKQEEADRAQAIFRHATSDFLSLLKLYDQFEHAARDGKDDVHVGSGPDWCRRHFVNHGRMREWRELVQQLRDVLQDVDEEVGTEAGDATVAASLSMPAEEAIHRALLTGLIATTACREGDAASGTYRSIRGQQAKIFPGSVLFRQAPQWIMAAEIVQTSQLFARTVAKIDVQWIKEQAGHLFASKLSDPHVDDEGEPAAWQRVTLGSIVITPRERVKLAGLDDAKAREVFVAQVLASAQAIEKGVGACAFMRHNARLLQAAQRAAAKLRRKDVVAASSQRVEFFERVLPKEVCDAASLLTALAKDKELDAKLRLREEDCLQPAARAALDEKQFPSTMLVGRKNGKAAWAEVSYAYAPGKDEDGVTLRVPHLALGVLREEVIAWLVPGMRAELFAAMLKSLPKGVRSEVERAGAANGAPTIEAVAAQLAELVDERECTGETAAAVQVVLARLVVEALGVNVASEQFALGGLATHLRARVVVVRDETGDTAGDRAGNQLSIEAEELAQGRDIAHLKQRLASKLAAAERERASAVHDVAGVRKWGDFELGVEDERGVLTLIDEGASCRLTRVKDAQRSELLSRKGVRRLLAIASEEELAHGLAGIAEFGVLAKQYAALGSDDELRDAIGLHAVDKALLHGQRLPRSCDEFEERVQSGQGKLILAVREVAECVGKVLDARSKVAQRLGSGTNRMWAASIADMREHAAYLMPTGFLPVLSWQRLRDYPRYATVLRERLFALREDGSGVEKEALALVGPLWKVYTAAIAKAMSEQRAREEEEEATREQSIAKSAGKDVLSRGAAPRHAAKRGAPVVNVDAGVWALRQEHAMQLDAMRWALEELRAGVFGGLGASSTPLAVRHAALVAAVKKAME